MKYEVVTTNGSDQTSRYSYETYQDAVSTALENNAIWPSHDAIIYANGGMICVYRKGIKYNA